MAQHVMLDLETLSTASDAAIIQIGAVAFDPRGDGLEEAGLMINVSPEASMAAGLRVDWSTIHWWMGQADAARTLPGPGEGILLSAALSQLSTYIAINGGKWCKVWANGAAFDVPILEHAYRVCRLPIPWQYNNVLDVRTLKWLAPKAERIKPELAHNALSDARAQALWVQAMHREWTAPVTPVATPLATPLAAYWEELARADWTYMMSDDPAVARRGETTMSYLKGKAKDLGDEGQALYDGWYNHEWGRGEKPARPGGEN